MTKICPDCGSPNQADAGFCGHCGSALPNVSPPPPAKSFNRWWLVVFLCLLLLAAAAPLGWWFFFGRSGSGGQTAADGQTATVENEPEEALAGGEDETAEGEVIEAILSPTLQAVSDPFTPTPTATLFPSETPPPTSPPTLQPTNTTAPPPTLVPTLTAAPPEPTVPPTQQPVACQRDPGPRWGPTLYAEFDERLGCPLSQEIRSNAAFQYYQNGMMVWREDADRIYVLYNNGTYASFRDDSPAGYRESDLLKGGFGYLWNNNSGVRGALGNPTTAEANATDFAVQDFANGTIFYFFENDTRNHVLFAANNTWLTRQE